MAECGYRSCGVVEGWVVVDDEDVEGPASWVYMARGWPRMRPARVSCALMSALYWATFSLSYNVGGRLGDVLTRIHSGRREPQPRHLMPGSPSTRSSSHFLIDAATYQQPPRVGGRERVKSCGERAGVLRPLSFLVQRSGRDRGDVAEVDTEGSISGESSGEEE
ncbi:hypothetical protein BC629DRAFT_1518535 [Irpex lacteus]|nr:hypothetical protein BC629DRAFT_1518535 [Irpex lacteus]